jgi:hypothetical protein
MSDDELLARSEESLAAAKEAAEDVPDQVGHESPDEPLPPLSVITDADAAESQAHAADPEAAPEEDEDDGSRDEDEDGDDEQGSDEDDEQGSDGDGDADRS